MQDFTDLTYTCTSSPQNASDLENIQIKLAVCSPFTSEKHCQQDSGWARCDHVYIHAFESVGNKIVEDIIAKSGFIYKFKGKD
jgi:hypothetical protein